MSVVLRALKPLRRPRLWLSLWWLAVIVVTAACLLPARDLPPVPPGADKLQHLFAWFLLAASAVQIFRERRVLWRAAIGLVALGIVIELLQGALTATRAMDPWDVVADTLGVAVGFAIALTPLRDLLLRIEARWRRRSG